MSYLPVKEDGPIDQSKVDELKALAAIIDDDAVSIACRIVIGHGPAGRSSRVPS